MVLPSENDNPAWHPRAFPELKSKGFAWNLCWKHDSRVVEAWSATARRRKVSDPLQVIVEDPIDDAQRA
jgi:hypothetical protein